tara:strand:+ start:133 stop:342 length:210 start_codon:yes stop_codon:yes gene_type:complete
MSMTIEVEIEETYKGSMHYRLRIKPGGYGANHSGFVLVDADYEYLEDVPVATFRPEAAKMIKRRLEVSK